MALTGVAVCYRSFVMKGSSGGGIEAVEQPLVGNGKSSVECPLSHSTTQ
jgi:hypothetical protein